MAGRKGLNWMEKEEKSLEALMGSSQVINGSNGKGNGQAADPSAGSPKTNGIAKVRYTHEAMVDLIIAEPWISQNDLAARFGYTASWICQIISSDAFQARLAERSRDLIDPTLRATVEERFKGLVLRSLEILSDKLNKPSHQVPDQLALRTFELASRAAGYGSRDQTPPTPPLEMHVHLESLGSGLVDLLKRKRVEAIEGESTEVRT